MRGLAEPDGYWVILKDFRRHPATKNLRTQSGSTLDSPNFEFSERGVGMSKERHRDICQSRPCVTIGNQERDVHRFIKIEDF